MDAFDHDSSSREIFDPLSIDSACKGGVTARDQCGLFFFVGRLDVVSVQVDEESLIDIASADA